MRRLIEYWKEKKEKQANLEKRILDIKSRISYEEHKTKSISKSMYGLGQRSTLLRDENRRINIKTYSSLHKDSKSILDNISIHKKRLSNIGKDYSKIKRTIKKSQDGILLKTDKEVKEQLISLYRRLKDNEKWLDNIGHSFSLDTYDIIKEGGCE